MDRVLVEELEDTVWIQLQSTNIGSSRGGSHEHLKQLVLDQKRYGFENVVSRLADSLIQSVNYGLILHHDFGRCLQMSETKGH